MCATAWTRRCCRCTGEQRFAQHEAHGPTSTGCRAPRCRNGCCREACLRCGPGGTPSPTPSGAWERTGWCLQQQSEVVQSAARIVSKAAARTRGSAALACTTAPAGSFACSACQDKSSKGRVWRAPAVFLSPIMLRRWVPVGPERSMSALRLPEPPSTAGGRRARALAPQLRQRAASKGRRGATRGQQTCTHTLWRRVRSGWRRGAT